MASNVARLKRLGTNINLIVMQLILHTYQRSMINSGLSSLHWVVARRNLSPMLHNASVYIFTSEPIAYRLCCIVQSIIT